MVFAPFPILTVTVERLHERDDVHLHAGGQGFWIARMLATLDVPMKLCGCFGGEAGVVVRTLIEQSGIDVCAVDVSGSNVAYVHDRRSGERAEIAEMVPPALERHDIDALYGWALVHGLTGSPVSVIGGAPEHVLPPETYTRLTSDLRTNGRRVVADLSGEQLRAAIEGGIDVLKVSHVELAEGGWSAGDGLDDIIPAMHELAARGVETVVVSRAEEPALALVGGDVLQVVTPRFEPMDSRGAGDSMTAGIAAGLARGHDVVEAIRLGAAGGALNVTRHGLASGDRAAIEKLAGEVELRPVHAASPPEAPAPVRTPDELAARAQPGP